MSYTPPTTPRVAPTALDVGYTTLTSAVATPCPALNGGPAQWLVGVVNNSLSAQTVTALVYDNPTTATGNIVASIGPLGVSQVITFPAPGIRLANDATAIASGAPIAPGIQVLTR